MTDAPLTVFIGFDPRAAVAFKVCRASIPRHSSANINIAGLVLRELEERKLMWRDLDPLASTEFAFTRFLVPHLMDYNGWALFCDSDFLFLDDIKKLFDLADDRYAVMCVKHRHSPKETLKMDAQVQTQYRRKNWSSLVLWNCGHSANAVVTPQYVNTECGLDLHGFRWLVNAQIGDLSERWNWLEGSSPTTFHGEVMDRTELGAIHFTRGGPWLENWQYVEFAELWIAERDRLESLPANGE